MKSRIFLALLAVGSGAHAQESRSETQAIRCAAIYYIHTGVSGDEPEFGKLMESTANAYAGAYAIMRTARTGAKFTTGEALDRRDLAAREFAGSWVSRPTIVLREFALCNTWRAQWAPQLATSKHPNESEEILRLMGTAPDAPTAEDISDAERWRPITSLSFSTWATMGNPTRASIVKQLQESAAPK